MAKQWWDRVGNLLASVVGVWTAPVWMRWCAARVGAGWQAARVRPRTTLSALALLLAAGVGAHLGLAWWQARPRPVEVTVELKDPPLTDFANGGAPQPIAMQFSASAAPLAMVDKDVTAGIRLSPPLDGTWHWTSDRQLTFTPKQEWAVGTGYAVSLERSVVAPQVRLEKREFSFSSAPFATALRRAEFYQDPVNPAVKKVVAEFGFSHPVNPAEFEKRLEMRLAAQAGGVLGIGRETTPFTVSYDKLKLSAYVHSAVLAIPKEQSALKLSLDRGVTAQAGGPGSAALSQAVAIPGLYSLDVGNASATVVTNERYEPEQVLVVNTTQLVHERELAKNLTAWLLPRLNPARPREEQGDGPYPWVDLAEITPEVLKASEKLTLTPIAAEREHTGTHSFRFRADVGRTLYLQVAPRIRSFGGYQMRASALRLVPVPRFPAELRILSQGSLLAMSGEKKLAVLVRDLPGLRVELGRVQPSQLQHLVSQSRGDFTDPQFSSRFDIDNLSDRFERKLALPDLPRGKPHYEAIDLAEYLARDGELKRGVFLLTVRGYDPEAEKRAAEKKAAEDKAAEEGSGSEEPDSEPETSSEDDDGHVAAREERRLVLVTDLGLVIKQSTDGSRDVFVQSIFSGQPVAGVTVEVIAKNGAALFTQTTDAAGHVRFDKLEGLTRERAPLLLLAKKAGDMSFLPLNREDRRLDYSRFDVGGLQNARSQDQLSAYLFSDRGIYRPGEALRIGAIVKAADWARPLQGVPLEAEVLDARGLVVKRERVRVGPGGFLELSHATQEGSPTGNYTINLNLVKDDRSSRQIGSTAVKVQEFLPDRMKVTAQLSVPVADGWIDPKDLKGRIEAQNLFGTPAENRRVEASMTLNPAWPVFRNHPGYSFYDPQRANEGHAEALPEGRTGADGVANVDLNLARYAGATYRLSLLAKVFEPEGGRSVAAETSALVSSQPFLVGAKADGDLGYVSRGSKRTSRLLAIDPQTRPVAVPGLTLQLVERRVVSVLMRQANETYRYESRRKEVLVSEQPFSLPVAGHELVLDTRNAGNFSYVLRDAAGTELNRIDYSVAGQGNVTRSLERNAELQLKLDRKDYAPGDEIEVSIRAPYVGAGLITIERDRVYAQQWFKSSTTASVQKIRVPKDFEGTGYVNVQFIRDPGSDEIFMSPLSFGVAPFATSLTQRTNPLTLSAPELSRPGQPMKFRLKAGKPTRAVVFAVDEGILQVARYQNADPLGFFFQKRALEVKTSQVLDLILPEFKRLMSAAAPGGDEAGENAGHLNPFKRRGEAPAVYWSGIVDVQGEREFSYTVPDHFNGTLRVMAVAVNDGTVGVAQAKAVVRGDFVLSPNLPLAVSPGDAFEVSVGVANNVADAAKDSPVQVSLKPSAGFELLGPGTQTLAIGPTREGVALFRLKAKDAALATLGSSTLEFGASLGRHATMRRMDISVRPATPLATTLTLGSFSGAADVPVPRELVPEFRRQELAISPLPLAWIPGLMSYLDGFEHLCSEQLVSRTMPALVLSRRPEFARERAPQQVQQALSQTLRLLRTRQNADGGFGLWRASLQADEFASAWAVHLMMEARELDAGAVPPDLLAAGIEYLQQLAASNPASLPAARHRAYAIYLLTRNGAVTTPLLAGLRETLEAKYPAQWKSDAAAAFVAATYQLLKQESAAAELMLPLERQLATGGPEYRYEAYSDPSIRDAQVLYLLARHFPARSKALSPEATTRFMAPLAAGRFNTLSSAWTVLALDAMARTLGSDAAGGLSVSGVDAQGAAVPLKLPAGLLPRVAIAPGTVRLKLGDTSGRTAWYAVTQTGFDRTPPAQELKSGLEVVREYIGADGKPVQKVKVGDELMVRLSLRGLVLGKLPASTGSVALTDLLPGGFEPVVSRDENGEASSVTGPGLEFADVREDRVVVYASAGDSVQTYVYKVRATNVGEFTVPPAFAQSMYERERQARSLAGRITVVGAGGR